MKLPAASVEEPEEDSVLPRPFINLSESESPLSSSPMSISLSSSESPLSKRSSTTNAGLKFVGVIRAREGTGLTLIASIFARRTPAFERMSIEKQFVDSTNGLQGVDLTSRKIRSVLDEGDQVTGMLIISDPGPSGSNFYVYYNEDFSLFVAVCGTKKQVNEALGDKIYSKFAQTLGPQDRDLIDNYPVRGLNSSLEHITAPFFGVNRNHHVVEKIALAAPNSNNEPQLSKSFFSIYSTQNSRQSNASAKTGDIEQGPNQSPSHCAWIGPLICLLVIYSILIALVVFLIMGPLK